MMGTNHALSGLAAGFALAPLTGLHGAEQIAPFALTTAGYAIVPDLDHPSASATRELGWIGEKVSEGLRGMSAWLYARTKGSRDERHSGVHRHASHTFLFALVVGGIVVGCSLLTPWAALVFYMLGGVLAADRLGDWVMFPVIGGAAFAAMDMLDNDGSALSWQLGVAVALGCAAHCVGDALTVSGCPFLFGILPFEIKGETWYEIRLLGPLSFRTNTWPEHWIVRPLLMAGTLWAAWPLLHPYLAPTIAYLTKEIGGGAA